MYITPLPIGFTRGFDGLAGIRPQKRHAEPVKMQEEEKKHTINAWEKTRTLVVVAVLAIQSLQLLHMFGVFHV